MCSCTSRMKTLQPKKRRSDLPRVTQLRDDGAIMGIQPQQTPEHTRLQPALRGPLRGGQGERLSLHTEGSVPVFTLAQLLWSMFQRSQACSFKFSNRLALIWFCAAGRDWGLWGRSLPEGRLHGKEKIRKGKWALEMAQQAL